jgi:hypothetical protein
LTKIYQYRYQQKYRLEEYIGIGWTHIGPTLLMMPMMKLRMKLNKLMKQSWLGQVIVNSVTNPIEKISDVEAEVKEKFEKIGVRVKEMRTKATYRGEFGKSEFKTN